MLQENIKSDSPLPTSNQCSEAVLKLLQDVTVQSSTPSSVIINREKSTSLTSTSIPVGGFTFYNNDKARTSRPRNDSSPIKNNVRLPDILPIKLPANEVATAGNNNNTQSQRNNIGKVHEVSTGSTNGSNGSTDNSNSLLSKR